MNGRERIISLIEGGRPDRVPLMPITMMLAADMIGEKYGRYATDHKILVEGQIRTAEAYDFDYVSVISDPARESADCGAKIQYYDDQPPAIDETQALLTDKNVLASLKVPDPTGGGRMLDRVQACALFKERVGGEKLIEGWIEGPCALGADLRGINSLMLDFFDDPAFVRDLFEFAVELALSFARSQVEAGAELIGLGDAAASLVGPQIYNDFVLPYEQKLIDGLHAIPVPVRLHICGKTHPIYEGIGQLGCEIIDLDWMNPMDQARRTVGDQAILLGNIDPVRVLREGTPDSIAQAIEACHKASGPRYIVGAGCEVVRDTPRENVQAMTEYARNHHC